MPLIENGELADDPWLFVGGDAPLPASGDILVEFDRFLETRDALAHHAGRIGVVLANDREAGDLAPHLADLDLVVLEMPSFTDGRAYSQAQVLRRHYGYAGGLRVRGDVLADQAAFLMRCGFDQFELSGRQEVGLWREATAKVRHVYQTGYDNTGLAVRGR